MFKMSATIVLLALACCGYRNTMADSVELALPLEQVASGNYYLHTVLEGEVETDMLLDTGSGYVIVGRATYARLRQRPGLEFQRKITARLANGRRTRVGVFRLGELALSDHCVLHDIEVAVFPDSDQDVLGLNALRHMQPFTLAMDPPVLLPSHCD